MYNLDMDTERAMVWKRKVDQELLEVQKLLEKVDAECKNIPLNDDPIMKSIEGVANELAERWKILSKTFNEVQDNLEKMIKTLIDSNSKSIDTINRVKSELGL